MINKQKLQFIALISTAIVLIQVNIAGAAPFAYVTDAGNNTVSVINTSTENVTTTVSDVWAPFGIAVTPNGSNVYVTNSENGTVSVIDAATNNVTATVNVENIPAAIGITSGILFNLTPATPTIAWSKPANITYGTPLSGTQLDATASVPGSFSYNPQAGTKLNVGTHGLNTIFTPTDTTNYTTGTGSVSITVTDSPAPIDPPAPTEPVSNTPYIPHLGPNHSSYGGVFVSVPMLYSSEPYRYNSAWASTSSSTTELPNSDLSDSKSKAPLSNYKQKHQSKHHKVKKS